MPNIAIGLCIGLTAWTVCMGSTVLSGGFNNSTSSVLPSFRVTNLKDSKEDLKQKNKELPCIGNLFGEINWSTSSDEVNSVKNPNVEGCLAVWWEKDTYENTNWRGSWNLLWGMRDNEYGIIFSQNIEANNGKLNGDAALYTLNNNKQKGWALASSTFPKNGTSNLLKEIGKEEVEKKIPFPSGQVINPSEGWDFGFDSEKICSSSNGCESESPVHKSVNLIWDFVSGSENQGTNFAYEWIKNVDTYFANTIQFRLSNLRGFFRMAS